MTRCSKTKRKMLMTAIAAAAMFSGGISGKVMAAESVIEEEKSVAFADAVSENDKTSGSGMDTEAGAVSEKNEINGSGTTAGDLADTDDAAASDSTVVLSDTEALTGDVDSGEMADQNEDADSDADTSADTAYSDADTAADTNSSVTDIAADSDPSAAGTEAGENVETAGDTTAAETVSTSEAETSSETASAPETTDSAAEEAADPLLVPSTSDTDGWYQDGKDYYYYKDGKLVTSQVLEIKGQLYYFYSNGKMMADTTTSIYSYDKGRYVYYRAKADGKLYRSAWYQDNDGLWYHYEADGGGSSGVVTISGKKYLFDVCGALMVGRATYINGVAYAGTNDGQPKKLKFEGWDQAGGEWFYLVAGRYKYSSLEKIDGDYHFFNYEGQMLKEGEFDYITSFDAAGKTRSIYYHAKAGGKLSRNEWAYDEDRRSWCYFGDNCGSLIGIQKIGGYTYIFDNYGEMLHNTTWKGEDGYPYVVDGEGHATRMPKNGWGKAGNRYYYLKDGEFVAGEVLSIGGKLYGFSRYDYYMFANVSFSIAVQEDGKTRYDYYRAKADGSLYTDGWLEASGRWFYYGSDGKALTGIHKLGSTWYAFSSSGDLLTNTGTTDADGNIWAVSAKGTAKMVPAGEWVLLEGKWYYSSETELVKNKIVYIGEKRYYFDYSGALVTGRRLFNSGSYYRAGKDGAFLINEWYGYEYYKENGAAPSGIYEVNGKNYYFYGGVAQKSGTYYGNQAIWKAGTNGVLTEITKDGLYYTTNENKGFQVTKGTLEQTAGWKKINGYYYYVKASGSVLTNTSSNLDGKYYLFAADGTLIRSGWADNGWDKYYASADGALLTGDQKIGGKLYHFDNSGKMITGMVKLDGIWYKYGSDGVYIGKAKEGWNEIDGVWYYLNGGELVTGEKKIGKDTYYFYGDGTMRTFYKSTSSDGRIFGNDGKLVTGGWVNYNDEWFYVDPKTGSYVYSNEYFMIDGKPYCFDYYGVMQDYFYVNTYSREIIRSDSTGAITKKEKMTGTWTVAGGEYYYKDSDFTGWVGDYYVSYGRMKAATMVEGKYYVGNDGKWIKKQGWHYIQPRYSGYGLDGGYWIYIKADKTPVTDWQKIDGKWYYFSNYALITSPFIKDGKLYLVNEKGQLEQTVDYRIDGWYQAGDKWYYLSAGSVISGMRLMIDGNVYYVAYDGTMVKSTIADYTEGGRYYFNAGGKADKSLRGWKKINGKWFFFGQNGVAMTEWVTSGSNTYYIDYSAGMVTGYAVIDDKLYQFGSDGKLIGQVKYRNGWVAKGGYWFYFENGRAFYDTLRYIDGAYYFFDRQGRMMKNTFVEEVYGYAGEDGKLITNTWKKIGGDWFYFGKDGFAVTGWQKIGGKVYNFDANGKMIP